MDPQKLQQIVRTYVLAKACGTASVADVMGDPYHFSRVYAQNGTKTSDPTLLDEKVLLNYRAQIEQESAHMLAGVDALLNDLRGTRVVPPQ